MLLLASCSRSNDYNSIPANNPYEKDYSPLTSIMQNNLSQLGGNAGLILMYKDGTPLYKKYFGNYNDTTAIPVSTASTWLSTATVLSVFSEYTPVKLDDKVSTLYPNEFSSADRNTITIRQLLSNTAGFADTSTWLTSNSINLQQAAKGIGMGGNIGGSFIPPAPLLYGPNGSKFAYSKVGMQVAGAIGEKIINNDWTAFFSDKIKNIEFGCNMPKTYYTASGTSNFRIADGAVTTLPEFANFVTMLLNSGSFQNNQVVPLSSINEMFKDQTGNLPTAQTPYANDTMRIKYKYGLGCRIEEYKNGAPSAFGIQGSTGFSAWVDKGRNVAGILFVQKSLDAVNTIPSIDAAPYTLIRKKVAEILDK